MEIKLINNRGTELSFSPWGATWRSCKLKLADGSLREVLLSCFDPQDNQAGFLGSTIGRYSNRIAQATFSLQGQAYSLAANQGPHQLHGGSQGFHNHCWQVITQTPNRVVFGLISTDGDQGFPGCVKVTVDYQLTDDNQVIIHYLATTDQTTPINLTNHAYFNLDGGGDVLSHRLQVNADYYLPVNEAGIPEQGLKSVVSGQMDLRREQPISQDFWLSPERQCLNGYDHAYLLNKPRSLTLPAAILTASDNKIQLLLFTTKPALQVYTGNSLASVKNSLGEYYVPYAGIALETEFLPDSPNHPEWPHESCYFSADQFYHYTTIYQFKVDD